MTEHIVKITAAQSPEEAKAYMEKAGMALSGANGAILRAIVIANDLKDEQSLKVFWRTNQGLMDALGYLAAVEIFLINEMKKKGS